MRSRVRWPVKRIARDLESATFDTIGDAVLVTPQGSSRTLSPSAIVDSGRYRRAARVAEQACVDYRTPLMFPVAWVTQNDCRYTGGWPTDSAGVAQPGYPRVFLMRNIVLGRSL